MKPNTMETPEMKDAVAFLNCQIRAQKLMRKKFANLTKAGIRVLGLDHRNDIHMSGFINWCKLLGMPYTRADWDGNEQCESNWDIVYFDFKGYRFFELVDKEIANEGTENENN